MAEDIEVKVAEHEVKIKSLERIKDDEYRHIEILKNIGLKNKFDEINCKRIGEK